MNLGLCKKKIAPSINLHNQNQPTKGRYIFIIVFQWKGTQWYGNAFENINTWIKYASERLFCTCTNVQLCRTALILAWMTSEVQWASQTSMDTMNVCLRSWDSSNKGSSSRPAELRYFPHERQGMVVLCLIACDRLSSSSLSTVSSASTQQHEMRDKLLVLCSRWKALAATGWY